MNAVRIDESETDVLEMLLDRAVAAKVAETRRGQVKGPPVTERRYYGGVVDALKGLSHANADAALAAMRDVLSPDLVLAFIATVRSGDKLLRHPNQRGPKSARRAYKDIRAILSIELTACIAKDRPQ